MTGSEVLRPRGPVLRVWAVTLGICLAFAASAALPARLEHVVLTGGQLVIACLASAVLAAAAARASTLRSSWRWAARATTAWAVGQGVLTAAAVAGTDRPVVADLGFLVAAGCAITAAGGIVRGQVRGSRAAVTLVLDAALVAAGVLLVVHGQIAAALDEQGVLALCYPLIDVMIITALLVGAARGPRQRWAALGSAAGGLLVLALANLESLRRAADGATTETADLAALFVVGLALVATGGLVHRDAPDVVVPQGGQRAHDLLPYFVAPLVLAVAAQSEVHLTGLQRGLLGLVAALVTARHVVTIGDVARSTRSLAVSHQQYRRIVETSAEGIWLTDVEGRATFVNEQACRMLGLRPEQVLGRLSTEVILPLLDEAGLATVARRAAAREQSASYTLELHRADGTSVHCHVAATPVLDAEGRLEGTLTMATEVTERVELERTLWREARTDPLTGLANRTLLLERAAAAFADRRPTALVFCDLDGFKAVNDSYGHGEGDEVLREVARRLDVLGDDDTVVGRLGGDEFAVLLTGAAAASAGAVSAEVLEQLHLPYRVGERLHHLRASAGLATSAHAGDVEALLRNADIAMYAAKADRSGLRAFVPEMHVAAVEHAVLASELRAGLAEGQLRVHYQPVVSLVDRRLVAVEALVRWQHPERGLLTPASFIDVAEDEGTIVALGQQVLETVLRDAEVRTACGLPAVGVAVNVSPRQLGDGVAVERMVAAVESSSVPAEQLTFEITERSLLAGDAAAASIRALRATGARIALDDFGTGWSSLSHLRDHPVDALKLDLSYVQADDPASLHVLRAAAGLARGLGVRTVAEGVETEEQAARVLDAGCDAAQGWLFGRPVDHATLVARLQTTAMPAPREELPVRRRARA